MKCAHRHALAFTKLVQLGVPAEIQIVYDIHTERSELLERAVESYNVLRRRQLFWGADNAVKCVIATLLLVAYRLRGKQLPVELWQVCIDAASDSTIAANVHVQTVAAARGLEPWFCYEALAIVN